MTVHTPPEHPYSDRVARFLDTARRLADDGNPFAFAAWIRVTCAADPDAEVERVLDEYLTMVGRIADTVATLARTLQETHTS